MRVAPVAAGGQTTNRGEIEILGLFGGAWVKNRNSPETPWKLTTALTSSDFFSVCKKETNYVNQPLEVSGGYVSFREGIICKTENQIRF